MIRYYLLLAVGTIAAFGGMFWGASTNSVVMMALGTVPGLAMLAGVCLWLNEYEYEINERIKYNRARARRAHARRMALLKGH